MFFNVINGNPPQGARSQAFLMNDNWDDWFKYATLYSLIFVDETGERHKIGGVKIGQFNMSRGQRRAQLDDEFDALDERFFSLGQDDSYYENLNELGPDIRDRILQGLRDVARDLDLFDAALREDVTGVSLLRSVSKATVRGQFSRLARGGARLSPYHFRYEAPGTSRTRFPPIKLDFDVEPDSEPPTNIHVVIGRNGVGKTHLLTLMTRALAEEGATRREVGRFVAVGEDEDEDENALFANLVSVTFSAFDPFEPLPVRQNKATGMQYSYVGLKRTGTSKEGNPLPPKSPSALSREFVESVRVCRSGARAGRWRRALQMLETDRLFKDAAVADLVDLETDEDDLKSAAASTFKNLSSGHKVVLLTITRLVEKTEERTLVLLDEPEAHLHPPLLSAFIRALSDLLVDRNGVAIIATHSPVVLQEVPRSCVWKIRRTGREAVVERPGIETFGENVGILTREVFGLEVAHSGFHKLLSDSVEAGGGYETVVERFDEQLGSEAKAIIRGMIAAGEE